MLKFLGLAAVVAFFALPSAAATIVQNGSFEDDPGTVEFYKHLSFGDLPNTGTGWNIWRTLPGWKTVYGKGMEVQTNRTLTTIDAKDGNYYIDLDSHPSKGSNTRIEQLVTLSKVGHYLFSFAYSPRNSDSASNTIGYSLGDLFSGSVSGPGDRGTAVGSWTTITERFFLSQASTLKLQFWADGTADTYGGLLDDVSISYIAPVPVPATGLLMVGGLMGLAALKRRRKA